MAAPPRPTRSTSPRCATAFPSRGAASVARGVGHDARRGRRPRPRRGDARPRGRDGGALERGGAKPHPTAAQARAHWDAQLASCEDARASSPRAPPVRRRIDEYRFARALGHRDASAAPTWSVPGARACTTGSGPTGSAAARLAARPGLTAGARRPGGRCVADALGVGVLGPRPRDLDGLGRGAAAERRSTATSTRATGSGTSQDPRGAPAATRLAIGDPRRRARRPWLATRSLAGRARAPRGARAQLSERAAREPRVEVCRRELDEAEPLSRVDAQREAAAPSRDLVGGEPRSLDERSRHDVAPSSRRRHRRAHDVVAPRELAQRVERRRDRRSRAARRSSGTARGSPRPRRPTARAPGSGPAGSRARRRPAPRPRSRTTAARGAVRRSRARRARAAATRRSRVALVGGVRRARRACRR